MIKTVIFDMDGVIIDSEPVHYFAYQQHFMELKIAVSPEMYASFTGNSTKNIYEKLKLNFDIAEDVADLVNTKRNYFNAAFDKKEDLYLLDGVEDLIKDLYANGMQLILASSSANVTIERIFKRFNLNQYFTFKVSGEDFPRSKPHPAIFQKAAELSRTPIENCIVIEDSTNGIKAANAAGIFCIGYVSEHSKLQNLSTADKIINRFDELNFEIIKNLK
jgi:HAD superfamily hydrolase (TIGR01509 family)